MSEVQEAFGVQPAQSLADRIRERCGTHHVNAILYRFSAATPSMPPDVQALYHWLAMQEARMSRECRIAADELDGQRSLPLRDVA